jgi:hypothetical protein
VPDELSDGALVKVFNYGLMKVIGQFSINHSTPDKSSGCPEFPDVLPPVGSPLSTLQCVA